MTNTQQPTGIVGNTPAQINAGAASAATTARAANMKQKSTLYITIGLVLAIVGIGVVLANANLSFAWKMVVAIAMIVGGSKLAKAKIPALTKWAGIIKATGWIVLIVVLLMSGLGKMTLGAVDSIEAIAEKGATNLNCSGPVTITAKSRPMPAMRPGCTQEFIVEIDGDLEILALNNLLDGEASKYFDMKRPSARLFEATLKQDLPEGFTESKVTILTSAEAKQFEAELASKDAALIQAALEGATQ